MNNYDELASSYQQTHQKPDKQYSILPTILEMAGDLRTKKVLDLGCGDGFMTRALADLGATKVIGIDNSEEQLNLAKAKNNPENVSYLKANIFTDPLPPAEVIVAPFVLNYNASVEELQHFCDLVYEALTPAGRFIVVADMPNGRNLQRFGATKEILGPTIDGTRMHINLYYQDVLLVTLSSTYFRKETFRHVFAHAGFRVVTEQKPLISKEGFETMGEAFWNGYVDDPELIYLVATKS